MLQIGTPGQVLVLKEDGKFSVTDSSMPTNNSEEGDGDKESKDVN